MVAPQFFTAKGKLGYPWVDLQRRYLQWRCRMKHFAGVACGIAPRASTMAAVASMCHVLNCLHHAAHIITDVWVLVYIHIHIQYTLWQINLLTLKIINCEWKLVFQPRQLPGSMLIYQDGYSSLSRPSLFDFHCSSHQLPGARVAV